MIMLMRFVVGLAAGLGFYLLFVTGDVAGDTPVEAAFANPWYMALGLLAGACFAVTAVRKK